VYVFLLDELSGGFNTRSEVRGDLNGQLNAPFIVSNDDDIVPGAITKEQDRKAKEAAILAQGRDEEIQSKWRKK